MNRFITRFFCASFLLAAVLAGPSAVQAAEAPPSNDPYIFLLDGEALFGYSDIAGDIDGDFSTSEKWLSSLAVKLNEQDQLIALYNGSFRRDNIFIRQDEGNQQSNQLLNHNFSAAYKKAVNSDFVFKPIIFYDLVFVKETADESIGDGLYDYEDFGGGFENTHLFRRDGQQPSKLTYGFSIFHREYPNYRSLEALSSRQPLEDHEKDFLGYKADTSYRSIWWYDTVATVSGLVLLKDYDDKLTIDSNGLREGGERRDYYYEVTGSVVKPLNETVNVGFLATWKQNFSNLDFYDTRNSLTLTDDRFFEKYYDYGAYRLSPFVTFTGPKFFAQAEPSTLQLSYAFEKTKYKGRVAQNVSGNLLSEDERDLDHTISALFTLPMNARWSWLLAGNYEKQTSNQEFERTFLYSYESWSVLSGFRFEL